MITFKIYSFINFQIYNAVLFYAHHSPRFIFLLTRVNMIYLFELFYFDISVLLYLKCISYDVEDREHFYTFGENVSWYSHRGKQYGGSSKN